MAKKNPKASSSRNVDPIETLEEMPKWIKTNLLDAHDNNVSSMKEEKFEEAKLLFGGNVHVVLPDPFNRADSYHRN